MNMNMEYCNLNIMDFLVGKMYNHFGDMNNGIFIQFFFFYKLITKKMLKNS